MAQFITLIVDIGLGLLAYRLAFENRKQIAALAARITKLEVMHDMAAS